jgi:hypothetical protein
VKTKRTVVIESIEYDAEEEKDYIAEVNVFEVSQDGERTRLGAGVVGKSWEGDLDKGIAGLLRMRWERVCRRLAGMKQKKQE